MKRTDIGFRAVEAIAEFWQVDEDRIRWFEDGFDWWPGHYRQVVRVSDGIPHQGTMGYRITVMTDVVKDSPVADPKSRRIIGVFGKFAPAYAYSYSPVTDELGERAGANVIFVSTAYVNDDTVGWLPRFLASMAIIQVIDAQIMGAEIAKMAGGEPDVSAPLPGQELLEPDEILQVGAAIYAPAGNDESKWIDTEEFESVAEQLGRSDLCFGMGDNGGLTLETPFGRDTALIRLQTDQKHPQLGNGLLATLRLPFFADQDEAVETALAFNLKEAGESTFFPLLGCWCTHESRGAEGLAFSSFVPNALYQPNIATNVALWMLGRARWIKGSMWPNLEDLTMREIFENRLGAMSDES